MVKLIFLDMDGVIAGPSHIEGGLWAIVPKNLDLLGEILEATGADLVISSSWRHNTVESTIEDFKEKGFTFTDKIVGVTPRLYSKDPHLNYPRGAEIDYYIRKHHMYSGTDWSERKDNLRYVILDDDSDMLLSQQKNFVRTNPMEGLTPEHVQRAIEILNS